MKTLWGYLNKFYVIVALLSMIAFMPVNAQAEQLLRNIKVTGTALQNGATVPFEGQLRITSIALNNEGKLIGSGSLKGKVNGKPVQGNFQNELLPFSHNSSSGGVAQQQIAQADVCGILYLDLGPLHLDVLGLVVDLSEIVLDINAVSGPGNLLGNLLCAIVGLLDPNNGFSLNGPLQSIIGTLLNVVNGLL